MPAPTEAEVSFIVEELQRYLSLPLRKEDVRAAW